MLTRNCIAVLRALDQFWQPERPCYGASALGPHEDPVALFQNTLASLASPTSCLHVSTAEGWQRAAGAVLVGLACCCLAAHRPLFYGFS